jgi:hypothetical protein
MANRKKIMAFGKASQRNSVDIPFWNGPDGEAGRASGANSQEAGQAQSNQQLNYLRTSRGHFRFERRCFFANRLLDSEPAEFFAKRRGKAVGKTS